MNDKDALRKELLRKRDGIPSGVRRLKDRLIHEQLYSVDEFKNANVIFTFASFRAEVDTFEIIKKSLNEGKRVVLPRVDRENHSLILYEIKDVEDLSSGYMGIPEPAANEERVVNINNIDVVIIPGAGFDISGNRIGYGAGYYDILLSGLTKNIPIIAPAYEEQVIDSIPHEPHDIKVHIIVTDRRIIRCEIYNQ
jgi:5-formyltetrahydrofolate cyclo-ligase